MMNEINEGRELTQNSITQPAVSSETKSTFLWGMAAWELGAIAMSFLFLAFVALPGYFEYLDQVRGKESSARLTLIANCLKYLADQNQTEPGKKICELFDLNETLEMAQRKIYINANLDADRAMLLKIGAEPDCPGGGDYVVNLYMGEAGIVEPTCTLAYGPKGDYYREKGLYVADMSRVNGNIGIK